MKINEDVMKEMDFGFLEGREIEFVDGFEWERGVIVGCDYNIGITIVSKTTKEYIVCLRGPATWRKFNIKNKESNIVMYDTWFNYVVNSVITESSINARKYKAESGASDSSCAFI